jgi:ATP-binding cassette subfamily B protein
MNNKGKNTAQWHWLHKNAKHIFFKLGILTVFGMLLSYIGVQFALTSRDLIDVAIKQANGNLFGKISEIIILIASQLIIQSSYAILNVRVTGKLSISLKEKLFNSIMKKDYQKISAYHSGELLNRINSDIGVITSGIMTIIPNVFSLSFRIILSFLALFVLDRPFAIFCLIVGPVILLTARLYSRKMKSLHKKSQETDGKTKSFMQECLQNLLVIKAYKKEDSITGFSRILQLANFKINLKRNNITVIMNIMFYLVLTAGYYLSLSYCAYKISIGLMTFGTLTAILQLIGQVQAPFKDLSSVVPQYYAMIASVERILEIEQITPVGANSVRPQNHPPVGANSVRPQCIQITNLSFSYKNETIFKNADFTMQQGEFIAISGISGIGKSTLLKLIMGILMPQAGEIAVNNSFAYVPQGNMILSGTIKENIAFYNDIEEERIIESVKIAEIFDFIEMLPNKFDTILGEKGLGLSEGQIQRIAIARAIYYDAPLLLLDEATSALDEETEKAVLLNIKNLKNKSCIVISHKKSAFEICDRQISIIDNKIMQ